SFFRHVFHGESAADSSAVEVFLTGGIGWQPFSSWPPDTRTLALYLRSSGHANSDTGDGSLSRESPLWEPEDVFVYDPRSPIKADDPLGPNYPLLTPAGPVDQRPVESSTGVLVFSSAPLQKDVLIGGRAQLRLHAWSNVVDTDFVATVCDVDTAGRSVNIARGIRRTGAAVGGSRACDDMAEYVIELNMAAHRFRAGHRIRLQVTSSCFPCWEPN